MAATNTLSIKREFFNAKHEAIDVDELKQGDTVIERITIGCAAPGGVKLSDLIVEDLVPAAFEPMSNGAKVFARKEKDQVNWVMRSEAHDDRVLVFSKEFSLEEGKSVFVENLLNVVSPGEFVMPAARVEAMYAPSIWASTGTCRIKVSRK